MDIAHLFSDGDGFAVLLAAVATFGLTVFVAWPWLAPETPGRRLREQADGTARQRINRREAKAAQQAQPVGLREKQSRALARIIGALRISDRLNDGQVVHKLQQAGYRGRGAAMQYLVLRIISPVVLLCASAMFAFGVMPPYQPLYIKAGIVIGGGIFGWFLPPILLRNRITKRKIEIGRAWPDAVDLMLICAETGMSIEHGFRKVAEEMAATSIELAKEMSLTNAELNYLKERRQAYENLARRVDLDAVKAVTGTLIQSERYGTPLGQSLRVLAQESRALRMAAAEKKAAALPPKLTVPMIIFFLPVLFAIIITPAVLQILEI